MNLSNSKASKVTENNSARPSWMDRIEEDALDRQGN